MKNLFDPASSDDIQRRIVLLQPGSEPAWGQMTVAQMLAHCSAAMQMAMGEITSRRAPFPLSIIGRLIKPLVFGNDKPIRRNAPSAPELFPTEPEKCNFDQERARLIKMVSSFVNQGAPCCSRQPHPFFGPLTPEQWAILMYKHLDHHLRQFGV